MQDYIRWPNQNYLEKSLNLYILGKVEEMLRYEADCDWMYLIIFVDELEQLSSDHHFL